VAQEYKTILVHQEDGVGIMTMHRPEAMNAINQAMFKDMADCLDDWEVDPSISVVIITGGEEFFASGLDLEELKHHNEAQEDLHQQSTYRLYRKVATFRKPLIAAMAGPVIGGAADIAEFADFRIAAENVTIGWPQIKFGWITFIEPLAKIIGLSKAKDLQWTGRIINSKEASEIGLLDKVVPVGQVLNESLKYAKRIARGGTKMLLLYKELATHAPAMDPTASFCYTHSIYRGTSNSPQTQAAIQSMIDGIKAKKSQEAAS
jgi:enoyl-CoA hydratase